LLAFISILIARNYIGKMPIWAYIIIGILGPIIIILIAMVYGASKDKEKS